MKNLLKLHENLVIFPLKFSQDFNGFWFHSVRRVKILPDVHATCISDRSSQSTNQ